MPHDVFISYSAKDKKAADAACALMEAHNIRCWIAPRDVLPGTSWAEAILDAMEHARVMVLIFSAHANQSSQIKHEVERAVSRGLTIVPVRLEDVLPAKALEYFISSSHWLDAFPPPVESYLNKLAESVRRLLDDNEAATHVISVKPPQSPPWIQRHWRAIAGGASALVLLIGTGIYFARSVGAAPEFVVAPIKMPAEFGKGTGTDGGLLAAHLLDRLQALEKVSDVYSLRATDKFVGDWLGAEAAESGRLEELIEDHTRIGGDVENAGGGWQLTVRATGHGAKTFPIDKDKVDPALDAAADWLFQELAPYRYAIVLGQRSHLDQEAVFLKLTQTPGNPEHKWADSKLSEHYFATGRYDEACDTAQDALTQDSSFIPAMLDLANCRVGMGDLGSTQKLVETSIKTLSSNLPPDLSPAAAADLLPQLKSRIVELSGAWLDAIPMRAPVRNSTVNYLNKKMPPLDASDFALGHDVGRARAVISEARGVDANVPVTVSDAAVEDGKALRQFQSIGFAPAYFFIAAALDDWGRAAADLEGADRTARAFGNVTQIRYRYLWPWLAYAYARSGNLKGSEALIAKTPHDCYVCLQMRGRIAAAKGDKSGAEQWFRSAVDFAPALPFAYADWGAALMASGDIRGAIAKFRRANEKGPHDADPLEMWGEALMAMNRSDLALAKFEEADKYTHNWGHLHLKWGDALWYAGDHSGAYVQYRAAGASELSAADKIVLAAHLKNAP